MCSFQGQTTSCTSTNLYAHLFASVGSQAIQYVAEHGEVCPAGWKPGDKTMVADPEKSLDYFSTVGGDEVGAAWCWRFCDSSKTMALTWAETKCGRLASSQQGGPGHA